jgi:tetratricopeptide (TPR) repeat protein
MTNNYNTEDIVRYINGQMDAAEAAAFEQDMHLDSLLMEEVAAQRKLSRVVQIASIKNRLDSIHEEFIAGENKVIPMNAPAKSRLWNWIAAAAVIAGLGIFMYLYQWRSSAGDKIFAEYFSDDAGTPSLMDNKATTFDEAMVYYKSGDYQTAGSKFNQLLAVNPKNDTLKYYEALCQVRLKNEDKALELLSSTSKSLSGDLAVKSKWYLALVLIHQKKANDAVVILQELANSQTPYMRKATLVLAELKDEKLID